WLRDLSWASTCHSGCSSGAHRMAACGPATMTVFSSPGDMASRMASKRTSLVWRRWLMQRCAEASRSWPCRLLSALIALFKDAAVLLADAVCPASQRTPQVRGVQVVHAARGKQPWSPWSMAKVCRRTCQLILRSPAFLQARHIGPLALVLLEGAAALRAEDQLASEVPLGLER